MLFNFFQAFAFKENIAVGQYDFGILSISFVVKDMADFFLLLISIGDN